MENEVRGTGAAGGAAYADAGNAACSSYNAFRILCKIQSKSFLASMGFDSNNGSAALRVVFGSIKGLLMVLAMVGVSFLIGAGVAVFDPASLPATAVLFSSIVCLVSTLSQSGASLFSQNDYDFRMTLPVSSRVVVLSQVVSFFAFQVFWSILTMAPMLVMYFTLGGAGFGAPEALISIVTVLLTPMVPVCIGMAISFAMTMFSLRFRYSSIIYIAVAMILIVAFYVVYFAFVGNLNEIEQLDDATVAQGIAILRMVVGIWPFGSWAGSALVAGDALSLVLFAVVSIAVPLVLLEIFSKSYMKLNAILSSRNRGSNVDVASATRSGSAPLMAMAKKELRTLLSMPQYAINSLLGEALMLIAAIIVASMGTDAAIHGVLVSYMGFDEETAQAANGLISVVVPWVLVFLGAMGSSSCCSISLEGRSAWIMASAPVSTGDVILSKLLANGIHLGICTIVSVLLLAVSGALDAVGIVCSLLLVFGVAFMNSCLGLSRDCKNPNLTWIKPADVTKRSMPVMIVSIASIVEFVVGLIGVIAISAIAGAAAANVFTIVFAIASIVVGLSALRRISRKPLYA